MRELLTSGAVGNIELNAQKKIREDIQKRWERSMATAFASFPVPPTNFT